MCAWRMPRHDSWRWSSQGTCSELSINFRFDAASYCTEAAFANIYSATFVVAGRMINALSALAAGITSSIGIKSLSAVALVLLALTLITKTIRGRA